MNHYTRAGYYSSTDLAKKHGLGKKKQMLALDARLSRWRKANPDGQWIEDTERKRNEPRFLYLESAVMHIIENLRRATQR